MDCFCGCGKKLARRQVDANLQAGQIAVELLAWDKARSEGRLGSPAADDGERVLKRGADCYQRLLRGLHGEDAGYAVGEGEAWLAESERERLDRGYMTKRGNILTGGNKLLLTEEDLASLDRLHPERSFSADARAPEGGDGLSEELSRLGALHAEGVLTDEEFAAAKSCVLRR
jgi:hypothetical protein